MRKKIKCPQCGLVQWDDGSCKRCKMAFEAEEQTMPAQGPPDGQEILDQGVLEHPLPNQFPPDQTVPPQAPAQPATQAIPPSAQPPAPDMYREPAYGTITEEVLVELEKARPWMAFVALMGIITSILNIIFGAFFLIMAGKIANQQGVPSWLGLLYLAIGVFYWDIFSKLRKSAAPIKNMRVEGSEALLQFAHFQRRFWGSVGSVMVAMILLIVVIVLITLVAR